VLQSCRLEGVDEPLRCGTYQVFENREARSGRRIAIHVVVLPSTGRAAPDPLFVLQGGPGQAASDLAEFYAGRSWAATRRDREIVLVDQRGTGRSNRLDCSTGDEDGPHELRELLPLEVVRRCRQALETRADLGQYTTHVAMADLDDVRAALGYETVNLYGTSYGTRAALVYARMYGPRVRTMVLKGVAPPSLVIPVPFAEDTERSLQLLVADCASDAACAAAFPDLPADIDTLFRRLGRGPVTAAVRDSATGRVDTLRLTHGIAANLIRSVLQATTTSAELPLLIHRAAGGDPEPLARLALTFQQLGARGVSRGMFLSVTCAEDIPFIDLERAAARTTGTLLGTYWLDRLLPACAQWPMAPVSLPDIGRIPVPALLISGHLDPATPPRWGEEAAKLLPNSRHVVVRNGSHSFAGMAGCVDLLIADFLQAGVAEGLDDACAHRIKRPPFALAGSRRASH
jgi:pimeloyl-ACP methyl ester carboxylesterase